MTTANTVPSAAATQSELRRGWRMIVAAMIGVACGASPVPYTSIGQLIGPVHEETGWSIGDIALAITLYGLAASAMSPWVGALADRHGVRRVALVTHGFHMQRSILAFERAGLQVIPAPTALLVPIESTGVEWLPSAMGLQWSRLMLREWLGLQVARAP